MISEYSDRYENPGQNELVEKIGRANEVIQKAFSHYDRMDVNLVSAAIRKANRTRELSNRRVLFVIGCTIVSVILFVSILAILVEVFGLNTAKLGMPMVFAMTMFMIAGVVIGSILPSKLAEMDKKYDELIQKAGKEKKRGDSVLQKNLAEIEFLDEDYWYPLATETMFKFARQGRATTLPELYEKYDEQQFRWKTEAAFEKMFEQQQSQMNILNSIKENTTFSAIANVYTAKVLHDTFVKPRRG